MSTNHADFKVKHGLVVNTTASFLSTVTSVSTTTGGVILSGGAGIAKDVVIGGSLNVGPVGNGVITSQGDISLTSNGGSVIVTTSTNATNTTTGALQVVGGVGIQGDLYARNLYSNGQQVGLQSNTTTNLAGGLQYQIPYQSGPGSTTFIIPPPTTQNSLLQFTTGTGFTWTNTTTVGGGTFFYSPIVDTFTSNGTTTTFALSVTPASKNLLTVVIDGVTQLQTAFSLSGNNLVFSEIPYNGAVIDVHYSQVLSTTTSPAAGFPGQIQYNWNGMISGTTFMSYNSATGVVSITATTAATSTQTGALTVTGGMGIGGDLYVGGDIVANRLTIQLTTVTTTLVTTDDIISTYNTTPTNSTNTGALQIGGGIGVAGGGYFGGVITATNVFVNGYAVSTASALTIQGSGVGLGTAGTLNFATGTIATVANSLATIWLNTATLMSNAVTAINLAGGAFGSIPVQSGSGTTSFIAAGTQGQMFVHGVGQGYWENTSSIYVANASVATNIRAGTAGQLVYQSAANTTGFINTATTGNFLQANYAGAPTWTSTSSMYVYRATIADSASGTAGSVANALSTGTGLLFNAGTTYDGSAARTISLNTTTLVATAVTAFTANKVANALSAGTGLTGTAFDGSAAVTWTLNTATLMQVATQVVQSHSTGTGILGSSYNGSTAQTWTLDTSTLMARAVQTVQSLTAGTGLTGTAFNGSTAQTWTLNTATLMQTAVNLAGGSAGQFAYQTAANTTAFMSTGSMYVYRATIADSASGSSAQVNTQAQTANATYFPTFVDSNNSGATGETVYTTSSFILNPSTGQVGLGYISTSSRLTVTGRIESMTDPASEGGQVVLRGKNWYRWSIDNYQDTFRIIREDDVTEANGQSALIISSGTNSAVMLGTTTPYSGERLAVNGGVYVNGIATATTFVGALTGTASNATTATAAATAYSTIGTHTAGTGLSGTAFNGSANQTWTLNTATLMANAVTAINLAGGTAGQFPYQTGAGATSFVSTSNMYVSRAAYVDTVAQVTSGTYYPSFVDSNNASAGWEPVYTTSSFSVNPSTGWVTAGVFAATNNGNGTNFKVGDDAWIGDVNTADTFRVTGQQNAANGYIIFGNNDTTALGRAGSGSLTYGGNVIVHGGNTSTTYVGRAVLADSVTGSAGSLVNAVTFNNAGSGDASGTTYNGGSARTISYNTLGAMPTTGGTFSGPVTFSGAVTFSGTATYVLSTQTFYTDNILNLHVPPSGVNGQWTQDDGKDVGFKFHYYTNSTDTNAALVLANDTKWLEWYSSGAEGTSTFAGSTYGNFKTGGIWATSGAGVGYTSSQIGEKFGVNGGGYFNGIVTATTFVGALTGTASNATTATSAGTAYSTIGTHTAGTGLSGTAFNGSANQTWTLNTATLMQTAVNLASGSAGQLHYQTAANTSGFINTATTGNFLQANYVGAPTWTSTGSMYVGRAVIADSVSGSAGSLVNALSTGSGLLFNAGTTYDGSAARTISLNTSTYMALAANATSANKVANAHSAGTGLTGTAFDGSAAVTWTLNTATLMQTSVSAINLSAGSAMALPYQSASGTTAYLSAGTSGYILQTNGTGSAPTWVAASTIAAGSAPLTNTYVGFGSASNLLTGSSALTWDGTVLSVLGGSSNGYIKFAQAVGTKIRFYDASTDKYGIDVQSSELRIYSGAQGSGTGGITLGKYDGTTFTETMRIQNQGYVGIGTSTPYSKLDFGTSVANAKRIIGTYVPNANAFTGIGMDATTAGLRFAGDYSGGNPIADFGYYSSDGAFTWNQILRVLNTGAVAFGSSTTAYGSSGQVLQSNGNAAPSWVSPSTLASASATNADNLKTVQQTASASYYPSFVDSNNSTAAYEAHYTTSSFYLNPASGLVTIAAPAGGDGLPSLRVTQGTAPSSFNWAASFMNSSLGSSRNSIVMIGQAESNKNAGYIGFNHSGTAGSTSNFLTFGLHSVDNVMNITGNGYVGVGTTNPGAKLEIKSGDLWLNGATSSDNPEIRFIDDSGIAVAGAKIRYGNADGNLYFEHIYDTSTSGFFFRNRTAGTTLNTLSLVNGFAGIGNTAPSFKLSVNTAADVWHAQFGTSGGKQLRIGGSTTAGSVIGAYNTDDNTSPATLLLQRDGGSVGIGVSSTSGKLHVAGAGNATGGNIHLGDNTDAATKWTYITAAHYNGATNATGVSLIGHYATSTDNNINIGGNIYEAHPATTIAFYTYTSNTHTLGGTLRLTITKNGGFAFGTSASNYGSSGQILQSNGDAAPTWVNASTIAAGSAPLTNTYVGFGSASNLLTGSSSLTWNGSTLAVSGSLTTSGYTNLGGVLYVSGTNSNTLNSGYTNAADGSDIWLNYRGYNDGFSYFRNFNVGNGKGTCYLYGDGTTGNIGIGAGQAAAAKLQVRVAAPTSVGTLPSGVTALMDSNTNNYLLFRNSADGGTYSGIAFQDNNVGGYVLFGNAGGGGDQLWIAGYSGGALQYGTADSIDRTARSTALSWNSSGVNLNGAISFGGTSNYGSSGQVLQSNGNAAPTWVNPSGLTVSASTTALRIVFNDGPRDLSDRLPNSYTRTVNWDFVGAGTAGTSGNYAGVMTFAPWTGTTASTGDGSYQLAFGNASGTNASGQPTLRIRTGIDSTWNSWYTLLHAGNVSSYTAGGISNFTAATSSNPMDASSPPTIDAIGYVSSNIPSSYGLGGSVGSQSDGGLYVAGYSTSWYHEIYGDFRTGGLAVRGKYSGTWQSWRNIPCISVQDTAPSIYNPGDLWWESDTGRLKVLYYDGSSSQWVDVVPVVDTSLFFSKAGGAISGPVSINGTLDVTGNITATAEITAYYSDRRLKTDIVTIENALVKVKKLNGVTYRPNELAKSYGLDTNSDVVGLFADEVEAVLPQAVKPAPFDIDENGNSKSGENYKTIQYEKVVPLLVEAIKDQQKIIEEQQAKIDRLMKHLGLE